MDCGTILQTNLRLFRIQKSQRGQQKDPYIEGNNGKNPTNDPKTSTTEGQKT